MRSFCTLVVLILLGATTGRAQEDERFSGTWKLNVEKSKLSTPVRSATMKLRVAIDEVDRPLSMEKMDLERIFTDGRHASVSYAARYSGGDYEMVDTATGARLGEEAKVRMIDANTAEFSRLRDRKPLSISRRVLSSDGKMLTVTTKSPDGTVQDVEIWERQ